MTKFTTPNVGTTLGECTSPAKKYSKLECMITARDGTKCSIFSLTDLRQQKWSYRFHFIRLQIPASIVAILSIIFWWGSWRFAIDFCGVYKKQIYTKYKLCSSMSVELWQLHLSSTYVLVGNECCVEIQAWLYYAEAYGWKKPEQVWCGYDHSFTIC